MDSIALNILTGMLSVTTQNSIALAQSRLRKLASKSDREILADAKHAIDFSMFGRAQRYGTDTVGARQQSDSQLNAAIVEQAMRESALEILSRQIKDDGKEIPFFVPGAGENAAGERYHFETDSLLLGVFTASTAKRVTRSGDPFWGHHHREFILTCLAQSIRRDLVRRTAHFLRKALRQVREIQESMKRGRRPKSCQTFRSGLVGEVMIGINEFSRRLFRNTPQDHLHLFQS